MRTANGCASKDTSILGSQPSFGDWEAHIVSYDWVLAHVCIVILLAPTSMHCYVSKAMGWPILAITLPLLIAQPFRSSRLLELSFITDLSHNFPLDIVPVLQSSSTRGCTVPSHNARASQHPLRRFRRDLSMDFDHTLRWRRLRAWSPTSWTQSRAQTLELLYHPSH